ncbi:MAG: acyltransferase, partial [Clostridia bacterium]|nr:acyltransferase [Clostridia bacterium]
MSIIDDKLAQIQQLVDEGMSAKNCVKALELIGINGYDEESIKSFRLWNDYMPLELPYDECRRNLHILWESVDRVPLGINCAFAIPFRQILAKKLFKSCGEGFVANEGCRFNFANNIEIGNNVSLNAGCYLDAKGGIKLGDFAMLT